MGEAGTEQYDHDMARFPLFGDTSPGDLKRFLDLSRTLTCEQRLEKFFWLDVAKRRHEWASVRESNPNGSEIDHRVALARLRYGNEAAAAVEATLRDRGTDDTEL